MGIESKNDQECLIMGKGVAFGKKVGQTVSVTGDARVYSLKELTDRGEAKDIIKSVSPLCLELANEVLDQAEEEFGKVDRSILFTMADHLDFAVRRIQNGEQISNPLTDDIRIMFYKEYKVAGCIRDLLKEKLGIRIDEHETGKSIDVMSLSYNRLMNHVRYMVARAIHGEKLKMSLNDYMSVKFPGPYMTAEKICRKMEKSLKLPIPDIEIGYLAMHLERMMDREEE